MRVFLFFVWLAVAPLGAAPLVTSNPLEALAEADMLVVGRVKGIDVGADVPPPEGRRRRHPVFQHVAEVEVLRFYFPEEDLASSVQIAYRAEYPLGQGSVLSGPLWPEIREGEVRLFALRRTEDGAHRLWAEEGFGAVPPAFDALASPSPVAGSLGFVQREIANALASGESAVVYEAARYLSQALPPRFGSEPDPLPAFLDRLAEMLAGDIHRTEEAAAALLAAQGIPRPTVADLAEGRFQEQDVRRPVHRLIAWTLQQLPPEERERRLIETLLRNLAVSPWGAANTLREFAQNPAIEAPLSAAFAEERPGVLFVADALIREGRQDLISTAMAFVRADLAGPDQPEIDWQAG